jgi:hypothetical protein
MDSTKLEDIRLSEEAEETEAIVASVSRIRFIVVLLL